MESIAENANDVKNSKSIYKLNLIATSAGTIMGGEVPVEARLVRGKTPARGVLVKILDEETKAVLAQKKTDKEGIAKFIVIANKPKLRITGKAVIED